MAGGLTILIKGADTALALPDGVVAMSASALPRLASAGGGDVRADRALGVIAQGMTAFNAAAAATWLHGEAAAAFGPRLIAEDLPNMVPAVHRWLHAT